MRMVSCAATQGAVLMGVSPQKGTTMDTTNPFLTHEVNGACEAARVLYLDTLARMQAGAGQPIDWLERMRQQSQDNLDKYWGAALSLAFADQVQGVSTQLAVIVKEWGRYRALIDLIDADADGRYLDPADTDTYNDIQRAIGHQVVYLSTELFSEWLGGDQQRKTEALRQQKEWHTESVGMVRELRTNWEVVQRMNLSYADTALEGVKQAQLGAQTMYDFVVGTQANVVGMQQAFQHHLEQNLPDSMREAVREEARMRRRSRLTVVLILAVSVPLLFGLAYFLITHLY